MLLIARESKYKKTEYVMLNIFDTISVAEIQQLTQKKLQPPSILTVNSAYIIGTNPCNQNAHKIDCFDQTHHQLLKSQTNIARISGKLCVSLFN
jgi:hypothetical protein